MTRAASLLAAPSGKTLALLASLVLAIHAVLLVYTGPSFFRFEPNPLTVAALQTRLISAAAADPAAPAHEPRAISNAKPKAQTPRKAPVAARQGVSQGTLAQTPSDASEPSPPGDSQTHTSLPPKEEAVPAVPSPTTPTSTATPNENVSSGSAAGPVPPTPAALPLPAPTSAEATASASHPLSAQLGDLPPSSLISYKLTGQERGLTYHASGTLRWQHNAQRYEADLSVKAFLLGTRVWKSVGALGPQGLAPLRYSDIWRGERAAHFEAAQQRIVFSANTPVAPLQAGAQDQVSLFIQMAAAMAGQGSTREGAKAFVVGNQLGVQTATARDAVNWTLSLAAQEPIVINGETFETSRWLCLPRGRFDSQLELWLSKAHAWLPVRIRITQTNGNYIDMEMRSLEPLPTLAPASAP